MQHILAPVSTVIGVIVLLNSTLIHNASEVCCILFIVCGLCAVMKGEPLSAWFNLESSFFDY